jgi:hypothetical protein
VVAVAAGARRFKGFLLLNQITQGGMSQHIFNAVLRALKQAAKGAASRVLAIRFVHSATLKNDFAFNGLDDFENGDFIGTFEQRKAAVRTADGMDKPRFGEVLENFGEETFWDALLSADFVNHGAPARTAASQVHQAQNSIFACACNLHGANLL